MRYQYAGPGPIEDDELGLVRPGDVHDLDVEPAWGPWECLDQAPAPDGGRQSAAGLAPAQAGADGGQPSLAPTAPAAFAPLAPKEDM
jgi:hypothetical protein